MPPSTVADGPTVALSFANNFWGKGDAGYTPLLERMANAKQTNDELKAFYTARAALEDEYAKKLLSLARKPLGSSEAGTLRAALDVVRGETEATGKAHSAIAGQMRSELEEPLNAFASSMKERRKIFQTTVERLMKTKIEQTRAVNKARDRYEQDCLRIKGYLAQGHMVMGQEERKNKAKLEKTQINMATDSNEYEAAVKVLEETTGRWNKEWKAACDKFQDLEEERLDFTKSSLWSYANIASTVCVTDDGSCEKIRLSLENCEVEKDIACFIKDNGTGQEIPDPPRYINFAKGDVNDAQGDISEDENYSVAQFQRTINPAFRSASPNPSTYESHHDPQSELAIRMGHGGSDVSTKSQPPPLDVRRGQNQQPSGGYDPSQHGDIAQVPHNEYPADGMTMFCRADPPSTTGSTMTHQTRPSSRDSGSEYSQPTSYTSHDPMSGKSSPTKQAPVNGVEMPGMSPDKSIQKKRSGFFANSPFRRKSKHEKADSMSTPSHRSSTWGPQSGGTSGQASSPTKFGRPPLFSRGSNNGGHEDPVDPRASFQLNVGNNVFDVASPDSDTTPKALKKKFPGPHDESDPIAQALADLKGNVGKQSSVRVSADRYHGIATPAPGAPVTDRPAPLSAASSDRLAAQRGTPPPAYDPKVSGLGVPQPAFTSKEMKQRTAQYGSKMNDVYGRGSGGQQSRPGTRDGGVPRAASPNPMNRSRSPGPGMMGGSQPPMRSRSPAPPMNDPARARSPGPNMMNGQGHYRSASPNPMNVQGQYRSASPNPYASGGNRPRGHSISPQTRGSDQGRGAYDRNARHNSSGSGMEMQLSQGPRQGYGSNDSGRGRNGAVRPQSMYGGADQYGQRGNPAERRERSKSVAAPGGGAGFTRDGRPIIHFARAMYAYSAAIPEELSFGKGDVLAILRLQDDGWWEADMERRGRGLVPSNYLVKC